MSKNKILIIEDNAHFADFLERAFSEDYELAIAHTLEEGLQALEILPDLVILDLRLPEAEHGVVGDIGKMAIEKIKKFNSLIEIIVLTGTVDKIQEAVECMKLGAYDFILKGEEGLRERVKTAVKNALEQKKLKSQNLELLSKEKRYAEQQRINYQAKGSHKHPDLVYHFDTLIGDSRQAGSIYDMIEKITARTSEASVLITGESGTGKELVAAAIHFNTPARNQKPFITANIAALSSSLLESELFGIEKKVATGVDSRIGYFEQASGSTLFLDEISEIPLEVQAKLLRVLQEREILRVGSSKRTPIDVRIIAATNKDLQEEIRKGKFREDLFYRLNSLLICLPALRERKEDVPDLVEHFLYKVKAENKGNDHVALTTEGKEFLKTLDWPGNVRQLRNVIERAVVWRERDEIDPELLEKVYNLGSRKFMQNNAVAISPPDLVVRLPDWKNFKNEHEKFVDLEDEKLKEGVFISVFVENEGNVESVKAELDIHANTANRFLKPTVRFMFQELCKTDNDIGRFAYKWNLDATKLEKTLLKANRLKNYVVELLAQYKTIAIIAEVFSVSEKSVQKVFDKFNG